MPIWAGLDLNQRSAFARQIYSLVPLTTRPPTHNRTLLGLGSAGYDRRASGSSGWLMVVTVETAPHVLLMWPSSECLTMGAIANSLMTFGVCSGWLA